jgi:hypothetical protein
MGWLPGCVATAATDVTGNDNVGCFAAALAVEPSRTGSRLQDQPDDTVIEHERAAALEMGREAGNALVARAAHVTGKPSMSAAADRRASPEMNASVEGSPCAAASAAASCRASAVRRE